MSKAPHSHSWSCLELWYVASVTSINFLTNWRVSFWPIVFRRVGFWQFDVAPSYQVSPLCSARADSVCRKYPQMWHLCHLSQIRSRWLALACLVQMCTEEKTASQNSQRGLDSFSSGKKQDFKNDAGKRKSCWDEKRRFFQKRKNRQLQFRLFCSMCRMIS